jgi:hypothetical protein
VTSLSPDIHRDAGVGFATILLCIFSALAETPLPANADAIRDQSTTEQSTSAAEITNPDVESAEIWSPLAPAPAHLRQVEAVAPQQPVQQEQPPMVDRASATQLQTSPDVPATEAVSEKLRYVAVVSAQVTYDDNIFIRHFDRESDVIFSLSPTVAVGIGDVRPEFKRLMLDKFGAAEIDDTYDPRSFFFIRYTPTGRLFIDHSDEDALDHDAALVARWQMAYLTLGMRSQFQHLTTPDLDVGGLVRRDIFSQEFSGMYNYSDRTSFESLLLGSIRHYSTHIDSREVAAQNWINYRAGSWTEVALGGTIGALDVEHANTQRYEQALARVRYDVTERTQLEAHGGAEFRQTDDDDRVTPVFGVTARYSPYDATLLSVQAARRVESSAATPNLNIEYTGGTVSAQQRFAQHYYLGLVVSYENAHYYGIDGSLFSRDDDVFSIEPNFRVVLSRSAAVQAGYVYRTDSSTISRFTFDQNQVFVQLDVLF